MSNLVSNQPNNANVWGFWGTLLWVALIAVVFVLTQSISALIYVMNEQGWTNLEQLENFEAFANDGDVLAVSTLSTFIVCNFFVFVAIIAKNGANIKNYLAMNQTDWRVYIAGLAAISVLILGIESVNTMLGRPVPEVMKSIYVTADNRWLLWLAIVLAAPLFEEIFFRGFIYSGLEQTFFGVSGAIFVTASIWAIIHLQYDAYEMGWIFVMGIVLGLARWATGSIFIPVVMHAFNNLISTVQIAYLVNSAGDSPLAILGLYFSC